LIYGDASGDPAALAAGGADEVLTHDGTDLSWAAVAAGGITEAEVWILGSDTTLNQAVIDFDTSYTGDGFGKIGTGLTNSSGIYSFPSTGYYKIEARASVTQSGTLNFQTIILNGQTTLNNSSYSDAQNSYSNMSYYGSYAQHCYVGCSFIFDVTDTTNCKFRFGIHGLQVSTYSDVIVKGDGALAESSLIVWRLGDT